MDDSDIESELKAILDRIDNQHEFRKRLRVCGGTGSCDEQDLKVLSSRYPPWETANSVKAVEQLDSQGFVMSFAMVHFAATVRRLLSLFQFLERTIATDVGRSTKLSLKRWIMHPSFVPWVQITDVYKHYSVESPNSVLNISPTENNVARGKKEAIYLSYMIHNLLTAISQGLYLLTEIDDTRYWVNETRAFFHPSTIELFRQYAYAHKDDKGDVDPSSPESSLSLSPFRGLNGPELRGRVRRPGMPQQRTSVYNKPAEPGPLAWPTRETRGPAFETHVRDMFGISQINSPISSPPSSPIHFTQPQMVDRPQVAIPRPQPRAAMAGPRSPMNQLRLPLPANQPSPSSSRPTPLTPPPPNTVTNMDPAIMFALMCEAIGPFIHTTVAPPNFGAFQSAKTPQERQIYAKRMLDSIPNKPTTLTPAALFTLLHSLFIPTTTQTEFVSQIAYFVNGAIGEDDRITTLDKTMIDILQCPETPTLTPQSIIRQFLAEHREPTTPHVWLKQLPNKLVLCVRPTSPCRTVLVEFATQLTMSTGGNDHVKFPYALQSFCTIGGMTYVFNTERDTWNTRLRENVPDDEVQVAYRNAWLWFLQFNGDEGERMEHEAELFEAEKREFDRVAMTGKKRFKRDMDSLMKQFDALSTIAIPQISLEKKPEVFQGFPDGMRESPEYFATVLLALQFLVKLDPAEEEEEAKSDTEIGIVLWKKFIAQSQYYKVPAIRTAICNALEFPQLQAKDLVGRNNVPRSVITDAIVEFATIHKALKFPMTIAENRYHVTLNAPGSLTESLDTVVSSENTPECFVVHRHPNVVISSSDTWAEYTVVALIGNRARHTAIMDLRSKQWVDLYGGQPSDLTEVWENANTYILLNAAKLEEEEVEPSEAKNGPREERTAFYSLTRPETIKPTDFNCIVPRAIESELEPSDVALGADAMRKLTLSVPVPLQATFVFNESVKDVYGTVRSCQLYEPTRNLYGIDGGAINAYQTNEEVQDVVRRIEGITQAMNQTSALSRCSVDLYNAVSESTLIQRCFARYRKLQQIFAIHVEQSTIDPVEKMKQVPIKCPAGTIPQFHTSAIDIGDGKTITKIVSLRDAYFTDASGRQVLDSIVDERRTVCKPIDVLQ